MKCQKFSKVIPPAEYLQMTFACKGRLLKPRKVTIFLRRCPLDLNGKLIQNKGNPVSCSPVFFGPQKNERILTVFQFKADFVADDGKKSYQPWAGPSRSTRPKPLRAPRPMPQTHVGLSDPEMNQRALEKDLYKGFGVMSRGLQYPLSKTPNPLFVHSTKAIWSQTTKASRPKLECIT